MNPDTNKLTVLRELAAANAGLLRPEDVVEAARPKTSPLHSSFTWDDTEAAHNWRLWQARMLIRATVHLVDVDGDKRPVRAFVSLTTDRDGETGGYREMLCVMSNAQHRKVMLQDAINELRSFEDKYNSLKELAEVFAASRKLCRQYRR